VAEPSAAPPSGGPISATGSSAVALTGPVVVLSGADVVLAEADTERFDFDALEVGGADALSEPPHPTADNVTSASAHQTRYRFRREVMEGP
jgi:hypothetical protein